MSLATSCTNAYEYMTLSNLCTGPHGAWPLGVQCCVVLMMHLVPSRSHASLVLRCGICPCLLLGSRHLPEHQHQHAWHSCRAGALLLNWCNAVVVTRLLQAHHPYGAKHLQSRVAPHLSCPALVTSIITCFSHASAWSHVLRRSSEPLPNPAAHSRPATATNHAACCCSLQQCNVPYFGGSGGSSCPGGGGAGAPAQPAATGGGEGGGAVAAQQVMPPIARSRTSLRPSAAPSIGRELQAHFLHPAHKSCV
jgi:hypothetical protein